MKAKVKATGEIVEVYERYDDYAGEVRWEELYATYSSDELDFDVPQDTSEEVTIEGYAVRWHDGEVTVFQREPICILGDNEHYDGWKSRDGCRMFLPNDALPSVTYEDSPQRVKITITTMDQ